MAGESEAGVSTAWPLPDGAHRPQARVLVIDDDPEVRDLIADLLGGEGFQADATGDVAAALARMEREAPDVVLLDIGMPAMNGLDVLAELRRRSSVPIIFVTGRGSETDRVLGLRLGADDYVVKPFSSAELVARVHAVLRRSERERGPVSRVAVGRLAVDTATREVTVDGTPVPTTAREFDLLAFLVRTPRQVFSREQLLAQVWGSSTQWQDPATVTEHIRRLRKKIEDNPDEPRWLTTVRGVGYRFTP